MSHRFILAEHRRRNERTRNCREAVAAHRAHMMRLLKRAGQHANHSLCLLGAGNGNDIDLAALTKLYRHLALVDLDQAALSRAVASLSEPDQRLAVKLFPETDVTGILERLESGSCRFVEDLDGLLRSARTVHLSQLGSYSVVCSSCLLSQLIDSVRMSMDPNHHCFAHLLFAVRDGHLQLLIDLLEPQGVGILVTDFVSIETAPALAELTEEQLAMTALGWLKSGNFFTGINPIAILNYYRSHVALQSAELVRPWRWDIGPKQFAVCAIVFRKRSEIN